MEGIDVALAAGAVPLALYSIGDDAWPSSACIGSLVAARALWSIRAAPRFCAACFFLLGSLACMVELMRVRTWRGGEGLLIALAAEALSATCATWRSLGLSAAERAVTLPALLFACADALSLPFRDVAVDAASRGAAEEGLDAARALAGAAALSAVCTAAALAAGVRERLSAESRSIFVGLLALGSAFLFANWLRPRTRGGEIAWALRTVVGWASIFLPWVAASLLLIALPRGDSFESTILLRKVYHIVVAVAVVAPLAIARDAQGPVSAVLAAGLLALTLAEAFRALECAPIALRDAFHVRVSRHLDSRDDRSFVLSHLYLVAGVAVPLWLEATTLSSRVLDGRSVIRSIAAPLALGIGDAAAAIGGVLARRVGLAVPWAALFGGPRDSPGKTMAGTLFYALSVIFSGYFCVSALSLPVDTVTAVSIVASAAVGAAVEVLAGDADNAIVPIYAWVSARII
jgi:dolichol kinase